MSKLLYQRPGLCLDFKRDRIRIHKPTLHLLGDPTHINLLIAPEKGIIAIKTASEYDHLSLKVSQNSAAPDGCYEIHSKSLMRQLMDLYHGWECNNSYRIYGKYDGGNKLTIFYVVDSRLLEDRACTEKSIT